MKSDNDIKSPYSEMFLIPKDIYQKVLNKITEKNERDEIAIYSQWKTHNDCNDTNDLRNNSIQSHILDLCGLNLKTDNVTTL